MSQQDSIPSRASKQRKSIHLLFLASRGCLWFLAYGLLLLDLQIQESCISKSRSNANPPAPLL